MLHELTGKVCRNHLHLKRLKMEIESHRLDHSFYPAIGTEIPLAGCHQHLPCVILEAEYHHGNNACHRQNAEEHLAQDFEMTTEGQQFAVICCVVRRRFRLILFRLRALLLRHAPRLFLQHPLVQARSSLS